jgi:hypothetical protein
MAKVKLMPIGNGLEIERPMTPAMPWEGTSLRKPEISQRFKDSSATPTRPTRFSTPGSPTRSWLRRWMIGDLLQKEIFFGLLICDLRGYIRVGTEFKKQKKSISSQIV